MKTCQRCQTPIPDDQPIASLTFYGVRYTTLHVACAYDWRERVRGNRDEHVRCARGLNAEFRSLTVTPAREVTP